MEGLLEKRLLLFAGKGGVGKTTMSAAVALELAKRGRKTLLVTVDPAKRLEDSLGVSVGFRETPIQPNLTALMLDPQTVLREHLAERLPQAQVSEHPLFRYVTQNLPGLNEMMAIGKLNDYRTDGRFDVIVVDTAPTGHALNFLSVPKAMEELMSDKSLLRWAVKGYAVWQRLSGAARSVQNVFRKKEDKEEGPPDIDFEKLFADIQAEASRVRKFLTDPENAALVLVTIPERLPVEETCDLHEAATKDLGMTVPLILVNKVQPDALGSYRDEVVAIHDDEQRRKTFTAAASKGTKSSPELVDRLLTAARFAEVRRAMNLGHIHLLKERLPNVPLVEVPLQREDVQGLKALGQLRGLLFPPAGRRARPGTRQSH